MEDGSIFIPFRYVVCTVHGVEKLEGGVGMILCSEEKNLLFSSGETYVSQNIIQNSAAYIYLSI